MDHPWRKGFNKNPERKRGNNMKFAEKQCRDCGNDFKPTCGRQVRCSGCKLANDVEFLAKKYGDIE